MAQADDLMTVTEVAAMLRMSQQWVRKVSQGDTPKLPVIRLGGALRYRRSDIERVLEEGGTHAKQSA